ncbi:MAG: hypothetical protein HYY44_02815 [Deltaproteobacteria bacterium]|nr:hypothetical protein [Deltaproteobacteria bacterium]
MIRIIPSYHKRGYPLLKVTEAQKGVKMPGLHVKFELSPEDFLSHLTEAAYQVALKQGFRGSFVDLRLGLQRALREMIKKDMFVTDLCGLYTICQEAEKLEPWSKEAEKV